MSDASQALPESPTIEAILSTVAPWQGRVSRYEPVGGGISNANWRVWIEGEAKSFFVKIPGRGTEMFINRTVALEASMRAEAVGIGPRVHHLGTPAGVEIVDFVEGYNTATNRDFLRPSVRDSVVDSYRKLHGSGPLSETKTVFHMIEEHLSQIRRVSAPLPDTIDGLLAAYRQARHALEASGLDVVPCFNDPMPGNFLLNPSDDLILIDYEYSSNNDRCYDLGAWSAEMFFDETIETGIIEAYFGTFERNLLNRLIVYKALADTKWTLWAMLQNRISLLDFDFYKYGLWKLLRAKSIMEDARWASYISNL